MLLLVWVLSACESISAGGASSNGGSVADSHTLSVSGRGAVSLPPGFAEVSVGVQTESETAAQAVANNNLSMENVMAALDAFDIAPEDMQTSRFSIYPIQNRNNLGTVIGTTFRVQNTLTVKVRELQDLGAVLDAVVAAGANTINGISFEMDSRAAQAAHDQALAAALADARRKADLLAEAAGVRIVDVLTINVTPSNIPVPQIELRAAEGLGGAADVPVSPGEAEVTVEVYVVYQIEALDSPPAAAPDEPEGE